MKYRWHPWHDLVFWLCVVIGLVLTLLSRSHAQCFSVACTTHGTSTTNLGLCMPVAGDTGWAGALNQNNNTLDSMFTNCALQPAYGGTGTSAIPSVGSVLVGNASGTYSLSTPSIDYSVLTYHAGAVSWANAISLTTAGAPDNALCANNTMIGRLALDYSNNRLYVCCGAQGWKYGSLS